LLAEARKRARISKQIRSVTGKFPARRNRELISLEQGILSNRTGNVLAHLMTSFAFILGVLPLVLATGAGANARRSLGISVFTGMIASTCLAVVFVPAFFVVLQRLQERKGHKLPAEQIASASSMSAHE
jgi:Cu/Ag efflux pump CusA